MYLTGGIGPSRFNEGFSRDYDLHNETAYAETCASVGLFLWMQRMLLLDLDGKYADTAERALYNGALSGLSLDGTHFFYENPLQVSRQREGLPPAPPPPGLVRLRLLPFQYQPPDRPVGQLYLFHGWGKHRRTPLHPGPRPAGSRWDAARPWSR